MMFADVYLIVYLGKLAANTPPSVMGQNFYVGTGISVIVFLARVSYFLQGGDKDLKSL